MTQIVIDRSKHNLYIFKFAEYDNLLIAAKSLKKAMKEVRKNWYPCAFEQSFSVDIVENFGTGE
jgi:hypothetical protein